MNAETLGALATIVGEAIAKAVQPLQQRIAELEGRKGYDDNPVLRSLETLRFAAEDARTRLKALEDRPAEIVAPAVTPEQLEEFRRAWRETDERVKLLAEPAPTYSDQWIRETFDAVQATLDRLKAVEVPKPYDDQPLRQWVTEQLKELPAPVAVDGIDGAPGADGKDALALEVLPEIDQSKSYVRNTYAKHNGGLWRSFEQTHGLRGWECIVDGVHAVMPVLEGKSLTLTVIQSSGTESVLMADLPIQEYKGVYRPEEAYIAHDTATWAGSLWHCNVTGTKAKPGDGSSDWTLAVKKGRDAKEVVRV